MKIGISSLITIPEFAYSFATLKITLVKLMTAVIFPWISADLLNFVTNFGLKKTQSNDYQIERLISTHIS